MRIPNKLTLVVIMTAAIFLIFASCVKNTGKIEYEDAVLFQQESVSDENGAGNSAACIYPVYPVSSAEDLKRYLESEIRKQGLPLEVGDIYSAENGMEPCREFIVSFLNNPENACIFSFSMADYYMLDGKGNPSFTIAFKDADNSQDMITILALVMRYISPELSLSEAEDMARNQDNTISTDGYSMPRDIGGYQIQARYTDPHVFIRTQEFDAAMGVKVTALKQIWGDPDISGARALNTPQDYSLLDDNYNTRLLYADFTVKNVWQHVEALHGDFWVTVDVESMTGDRYTFRVESMQMLMDYEFGVGQEYTLYISTGQSYGPIIYYAIQRSASEQFNSRGAAQILDYPIMDGDRRLERIEPEEDGTGTVYDVTFNLVRRMIGPFAAAEGRGLGEKQWPDDMQRDLYEFAGWYDNPEGFGKPYTKDTPIYKNTDLYAIWKYTGSGGCRPRPHRGAIGGVNEGASFNVGQAMTISAAGYNMHLSLPNDRRFRWAPISWRVGNDACGEFPVEEPFTAVLSIDDEGEFALYITYREEIFDGLKWQATGQVCEVEERSFVLK